MLDTRQAEQLIVAVYGSLGENGTGVEACDKSGAMNLEQDVEFSLELTAGDVSSVGEDRRLVERGIDNGA